MGIDEAGGGGLLGLHVRGGTFLMMLDAAAPAGSQPGGGSDLEG